MWGFVAALFLGLVLLFQNCAPSYEPKLAAAASSQNSQGTVVPDPAEQKALQILATNCSSCHGSATGIGGVSDILDVQHLIASGLIVLGHPESSPLVAAVEGG